MGLLAVGVGLQAASTVVGLIGNNASAQAARDAANARARLLNAQADERIRQTRIDADLFKRKGHVSLGDMVSSYAKAGVDVSGSPLLVLANSKRELETGRAELVRKGTNEARLLRLGASSARNAARQVGRNLMTTQIGTVLGGAASAASFAVAAKPTA